MASRLLQDPADAVGALLASVTLLACSSVVVSRATELAPVAVRTPGGMEASV